MRSILKAFTVSGLGFVFLACGITTPVPTGTQPAAEAPAPLPPTPSAVSTEFKNVRFTVPFGMAYTISYSTTTDVEFPYINPSGGPMPEHIVFKLNGYPREAQTFEPSVLVFPAAEYAGYSELTQNIINSLQNLPFIPGQALPQELVSGVISAQVQNVQFQGGEGVRYLTQVEQNPSPINSKDLIYYYQGLTEDGKYYVQVILPVYADFLPIDDNPNSPTPADGVPFDWGNPGALPQYLDDVTQKLNATGPDYFSPHLTYLDELVRSILISP